MWDGKQSRCMRLLHRIRGGLHRREAAAAAAPPPRCRGLASRAASRPTAAAAAAAGTDAQGQQPGHAPQAGTPLLAAPSHCCRCCRCCCLYWWLSSGHQLWTACLNPAAAYSLLLARLRPCWWLSWFKPCSWLSSDRRREGPEHRQRPPAGAHDGLGDAAHERLGSRLARLHGADHRAGRSGRSGSSRAGVDPTGFTCKLSRRPPPTPAPIASVHPRAPRHLTLLWARPRLCAQTTHPVVGGGDHHRRLPLIGTLESQLSDTARRRVCALSV